MRFSPAACKVHCTSNVFSASGGSVATFQVTLPCWASYLPPPLHEMYLASGGSNAETCVFSAGAVPAFVTLTWYTLGVPAYLTLEPTTAILRFARRTSTACET